MVAPSSLVILITIDCSTDPTISSCNEDSANCMCVSCPLCLKKTVWCVRSMMDSQMALQTRRAESRTDGGLELCCCDASRACSVITLRLPWGFDSDCPWNWRLCECKCTLYLAELGPQVLSAGWPTTKFSSCVLLLLAWTTLLPLADLKLSIQQLTWHTVVVQPMLGLDEYAGFNAGTLCTVLVRT